MNCDEGNFFLAISKPKERKAIRMISGSVGKSVANPLSNSTSTENGNRKNNEDIVSQ